MVKRAGHMREPVVAVSHTASCSWASPGRWQVRPQDITDIRDISQVTPLVRPTRRNPVFSLQGRYQLHSSSLTPSEGDLISAESRLCMALRPGWKQRLRPLGSRRDIYKAWNLCA